MTLCGAPIATAQAWVPPVGAGAVTTQFQWISNTGHLLSDGSLRKASASNNASTLVETEYAFTSSLSASVNVAYVFSKYSSSDVPPPIFTFQPWDQCRCWQSDWQDIGLTVRYNLIGRSRGKFALTPSISIGVPSHNYQFRGEAVAGRNLNEVRLAIDAGQRLDFITRRLSVSGQYSYAIVERVLDIPNNRSNITLDPGFQVSRRFFVHSILAWQRTHGGLRIGAPNTSLPPPGELTTPELRDQADRMRRANYFHAGAAGSYSFDRLDVFASYIGYVNGSDTHVGSAFTVGVSYPFMLRGFRKKRQ